MKFLIAILTSSRPHLARLCYDSVAAQRQHDWQHDIVIVVNSTNPAHKAEMESVMQGTGVEVIETPSNGRPGMGHNSLLLLFHDRLEYDYLIPVDGDDFLFPCAFHQLNKFLPMDPHCIGIQTNDSLTREQKVVRHVPLRNDWRLVSWFDDQDNWWKTHSLQNPFAGNIRDCATPSRPVLIHRSALGHLPRKAYGEDFALYDDMVLFLNLCEAYYRRPNAFRLAFTSNTYIYIHNDMNSASMTHSGVDYDREQQLFNEQTVAGFDNIKRWRLDEMLHAPISNPDWFSTKDKIAFATLETEKMDAL